MQVSKFCFFHSRKWITLNSSILNKINVLIVLLAFCVSGFSQKNNDNIKTIFNSDKNKIGLFLSPKFSYAKIDQGFTFLPSASLNIIFNEKYFFGIHNELSLNNVSIAGYSETDGFRNYIYNLGFSIGYIFKKNESIHSSISLKAGQGYLTFTETSTDSKFDFEYSIISPSYQIDFNLLENLSFGIGLSYNLISPIDLYLNKDAFLSGPSVDLSCRFHFFK